MVRPGSVGEEPWMLEVAGEVLGVDSTAVDVVDVTIWWRKPSESLRDRIKAISVSWRIRLTQWQEWNFIPTARSSMLTRRSWFSSILEVLLLVLLSMAMKVDSGNHHATNSSHHHQHHDASVKAQWLLCIKAYPVPKLQHGTPVQEHQILMPWMVPRRLLGMSAARRPILTPSKTDPRHQPGTLEARRQCGIATVAATQEPLDLVIMETKRPCGIADTMIVR